MFIFLRLFFQSRLFVFRPNPAAKKADRPFFSDGSGDFARLKP